MTNYKCFFCGKQLAPKMSVKGKLVCQYCGSRVFFKPRTSIKKVKAI